MIPDSTKNGTQGYCTYTITSADINAGNQFDVCSIGSGVFCISSDLAFTTHNGTPSIAITMGGCTAVVDFAGLTLDTSVNIATYKPIGIAVTSGANHVIRNGNIENFNIDVQVAGGVGVVVDRMQLTYPITSLPSHGIALKFSGGDQLVVQHSVFTNFPTGVVSSGGGFLVMKDNVFQHQTGASDWIVDASANSGFTIMENNQMIDAAGLGVQGPAMSGNFIARHNVALQVSGGATPFTVGHCPGCDVTDNSYL